jgi:hypothetical protein
MASFITQVENQGVIEIRDPEIDVAEVMRQIRQNMAIREKLPPLPAALGQARLFEERKKLQAIIQELHARVLNYGALDTRRTGWRGRMELCIKKCIRKVFARYLAQQQEVHGMLMETVYQLARYVEQQDEVLRLRFDQCDQQMRDLAALVRKTRVLAPSECRARDASAA